MDHVAELVRKRRNVLAHPSCTRWSAGDVTRDEPALHATLDIECAAQERAAS